MKKHFLLLLWMTLLPLAGWAASADLATRPTLATGLTYDGTAQALTTGSFELPGDYDLSVGGVLWRVTTTADVPEPTAEGVAFADVKATNAGKYWVWYKVLKDNDQYGNFDLVDSTGSVYVYGVLSEKGGEKKKFQELATSKGIKNGSTITIIGTRGSYNGKIEVMNAYFVSVSN